MAEMVINSAKELEDIQDRCAVMPTGTIIKITGRTGENLQAGITAHIEYNSARVKNGVATAVATGTAVLGPVGWLITAPAVMGMLYGVYRKDQLDKRVQAAPLAESARKLMAAGFEITYFSSEYLKIEKKS